MFLPSVHGKMGSILFAPIVGQLVLGIYLKLHIHEKSIRPWAVRAHGVLGKAYPVLAWLQMLFGAIAYRGYCRGGNLGQCLAHYIMASTLVHSNSRYRHLTFISHQGSGFIAYAAIMAILLVVGEPWIRRMGRSPEFFDSSVITAWVSVM